MASPRTILKTRLEGAERIAVLAVGSWLRGDDAAGLLAARELEKRRGNAADGARLAIFMGETAPENLTGEIRRFAPTHLIILDAADSGGAPGDIEILGAESLGEGDSFSSHRLPLRVLTDYLRASLDCEVTIVGIQPARCEFGEEASAAARQAARKVAAMISAATGAAGGGPLCAKAP